jgi:hypothetical protein
MRRLLALLCGAVLGVFSVLAAPAAATAAPVTVIQIPSGEVHFTAGDGRAGDDVLSGGAGFDSLDGGSGSDWCYTDADGGTKTACELPIIILP